MKYRVEFETSISGEAIVEANSQEEAEKIMESMSMDEYTNASVGITETDECYDVELYAPNPIEATNAEEEE